MRGTRAGWFRAFVLAGVLAPANVAIADYEYEPAGESVLRLSPLEAKQIITSLAGARATPNICIFSPYRGQAFLSKVVFTPEYLDMALVNRSSGQPESELRLSYQQQKIKLTY